MKINPNAQLDASQIQDRRGRGRGGGRVAVGGGLGAIIALVLALLFGGNPGSFLGASQQPASQQPATPDQASLENCEFGRDVQQNPDCRFLVYVNAINDFWTDEIARRGSTYRPAQTVVFSGPVQTRCGNADSSMGPFYCPADETIYFDIGFFQELETKFGARGGDFAEAYVVAHEYGHHLSNLLGQFQRVRTQQGPRSDAVRLELQADCFAGVWAQGATQAGGPNGEPFILEITQEDIAEGLDAARVVGDDYIQQRFSGTVRPESFTHGTSEQRQRWFLTGFQSGDLNRCDTFSAQQL
jgi:hypothetical protein